MAKPIWTDHFATTSTAVWAAGRKPSSHQIDYNPVGPARRVLSVEEIRDINGEIMHACLMGFAMRGYSGDLFYVMEKGQAVRSKWEVHVNGKVISAESSAQARRSVDENWPGILAWLELPQTRLEVSFKNGSITRVRCVDLHAAV